MKITKKGWLFLAVIGLHLAVVILIALTTTSTSVQRTIVRVMGLSALIILFYAATITLFLKYIVKHFGKSFVKIHHTFVLTGFGLLLIHGITYAIALSSGLSIELWTIFSMIGDTCAIIAIIAAIKRRKWTKIWRYLHMLMYWMLIFITFHGIFGGTDFTTPAILGIYISMLVAVGITVILKRRQLARIKRE